MNEVNCLTATSFSSRISESGLLRFISGWHHKILVLKEKNPYLLRLFREWNRSVFFSAKQGYVFIA